MKKTLLAFILLASPCALAAGPALPTPSRLGSALNQMLSAQPVLPNLGDAIDRLLSGQPVLPTPSTLSSALDRMLGGQPAPAPAPTSSVTVSFLSGELPQRCHVSLQGSRAGRLALAGGRSSTRTVSVDVDPHTPVTVRLVCAGRTADTTVTASDAHTFITPLAEKNVGWAHVFSLDGQGVPGLGINPNWDGQAQH
ncbi:MAG: hypothetical protein Q4C89_10200 [Deinococcus sp.]|uniref:hypothetical protein n=1 Tax=Deinococcus sp. TaxID=47478 RepID=UPI0026DADB6F|nr:hypothetical protein [Deinococcus sp.]MDO4246383.1 hypothetical protein [Deinococcus sp.]